jgi:hypothetical protein
MGGKESSKKNATWMIRKIEALVSAIIPNMIPSSPRRTKMTAEVIAAAKT